MTGIWYLVTSFIQVCHIVGNVFGPLFGKQEVGIWRVKKRFPRYGIPIWSLWPNIRFLPSIVAEKNATKNGHIQNAFFVTFFSATIDGKDLIFGHKLHIGTPYRGKRFWTHQIPTSCLPTLLIVYIKEQNRQTGSRNLMGPNTLPTIWGTYMKRVTKYQISAINSNLIFGHTLHIGTPYRGKRFLTRQIPTSCLPKSGGIIGEH
jgi:hypothetical protein